MREPAPDFRNIVAAARNRRPQRVPLYEHIVDTSVMGEILGVTFPPDDTEDPKQIDEYLRSYVRFFLEQGYDTVSFERLITAALPGAGALYHHAPGCIKTRDDFERYPWESIPGLFLEDARRWFPVLRGVLPEGMRVVGGPGNGVFECVQDLVGYTELCLIRMDDPELYRDLFERVGSVFRRIWSAFLEEFGDLLAVARFGDDLGFKSNVLIPPDEIRSLLVPQYRGVIELVHRADLPFLLHSCGNIFEVMDDLIDVAGIDAKHSNEDAIAPFATWVDRYGDRIGNFGGVDTDMLCTDDLAAIQSYVTEVYHAGLRTGGFAIGSGNSIPDYVPAGGYLTMVETVLDLRTHTD